MEVVEDTTTPNTVFEIPVSVTGISPLIPALAPAGALGPLHSSQRAPSYEKKH